MSMRLRFVFLLFCVLSPVMWADAPLQEARQDLSDAVISAKIMARFTEHRLLNPLKISVSTHNANVSIKGYVGSRTAFVEALRIVVQTQGVQHIDTEDLHIQKVNTAFTDGVISARAEVAVLNAKVLDDESIPLAGINAHTENGVLTLKGELPSTVALSALLKRVNRIKGVKKIISQITVKDERT
ncbi:MAG: BON domain-containing protein [Legionellaceae bacterium]|nr:BON domain-containing protein [Legionellaceae bacterium]